ncbi:LysR substrate-binding domain-containing protein [Paenirhodobacter populi]|uniref:LysR substrate-binding domain-containing protein n=1 Tax=Paenirhodobacter populi TaxID=2306993 RepID=UPI000FE319CF|nr:LysR substrate-binding domain-containing protein [Sinirhodobacter populi]RWR04583.1 LysR family transcriptional regulator [Sinirhodobacter populi]
MAERPRPQTSLARLPPLNAMRAFVVAARRQSFAQAAAELHVSAAAIGQHVRLLEEHLGGELFLRRGGKLSLSPLGQSLAPGLDHAFAQILRALDGIADAPARIQLCAPPSFALKWLVPRLDRLRTALPGIELEITGEPGDCSIRAGVFEQDGEHVIPLTREALVPLCSPAFAARHRLPERGPAALLEDVPLLHEAAESGAPGWDLWLRRTLPPGADATARPGLRLDPALLLDAAAAGTGIALGRIRLAEAEIADGRLLSPFGAPWPLPGGYAFAYPPHHPAEAALRALADWLQAEAAAAPEILQ